MQVAYLQLLTTEGYKFAFIKKAKETKKGKLKLKLVDQDQWLNFLPSNGVAFTLVPE